MMDLLFKVALSNACIALVLAMAAMAVEATIRRPQLAYLMWLLVVVKLVTPPLVTIPVVLELGALTSQGVPQSAPVVSTEVAATRVAPSSDTIAVLDVARPWLACVWLVGSGGILIWSLVRISRFDRLLRGESMVGPDTLQASVRDIAGRLRLGRIPTVYTTSARLSPLVWWVGRQVSVVIPQNLLHEMAADQFRWILAHELAHVRRRDHVVRWVEWLACVVFWWNPLVWWARHHLRVNEEICCDDLVLSCLHPQPRIYADSLLNAIECIAVPVIRPPAMASEINSGGHLKRRFNMIISETSHRSNSRWIQAGALLLAVAILPLGLALAGEDDAKMTRYRGAEARIQAAVEAGDMTPEQGQEKLAGIHRKLFGAEMRVGAVEKRLAAMVEAGEISEADAEARLAGLKEGLAHRERGGDAKPHIDDVVRRVRAAVQAGEITPEQARERMAAYRARTAEPTVEGVGRRVRAAVQAGEITPEQARERMAAYRARTAEPTAEDIGRRVRAAVQAGDITPEQARERMAAYRNSTGKHALRGEAAKIRAAVQAGELTPEEAREQLQGLRKRAAE